MHKAMFLITAAMIVGTGQVNAGATSEKDDNSKNKQKQDQRDDKRKGNEEPKSDDHRGVGGSKFNEKVDPPRQ